MSLLPGVNRLEALIEAQNSATAQHRTWEGDVLRDLKTEAEEIKSFAEATNGKVQKHTIELAVIDEAKKQALIVEAARVKAEEVAKASHVSIKQGLEIAAFTVCAGGFVTWLVTVILGVSLHN
jgi:hypothetical protein